MFVLPFERLFSYADRGNVALSKCVQVYNLGCKVQERHELVRKRSAQSNKNDTWFQKLKL